MTFRTLATLVGLIFLNALIPAYAQWQQIGKEQLPDHLGDVTVGEITADGHVHATQDLKGRRLYLDDGSTERKVLYFDATLGQFILDSADANRPLVLSVDGNEKLRLLDNDTIRCLGDPDLFIHLDAANNEFGVGDPSSPAVTFNSLSGEGFFDGSVGVGISSPDSSLHIFDGESGQQPDSSKGLTLENSASEFIQFLTPNTSQQYIHFGDPQDANRGYIRYDHSADKLYLRSGGQTNNLVLHAGKVGVMTNSPSYDFTINSVLCLLERSSDPGEPGEGECIIWMSDGSGKGDDGDVLIGSKAGGASKWATLFDRSAGSDW